MADKAEHRGKYLGNDIFYNPMCGWYAISVRPGGFLGITAVVETKKELLKLIRECAEWEQIHCNN